MQDKIERLSLRLPIYIYLLITIYFIFANLIVGVKFDKYFALALFILSIVSYLFRFHIKKVAKFIYKNTRVLKILLLLAVLIGLILRLSFLLYEYKPVSDPQTFYDTAIVMAENDGRLVSDSSIDKGGLNVEEYYAIHPFLFMYTKLLSIVMGVVGSGYAAVLTLNIVFDILGGFLIYLLLRRISKDERIAMIGGIIWSLSPFNIIFCGLSLPIIIVNSMIILCFLLSYFLIKNVKDVGKFLLLCFGLGIAISVTNTFRPIMAIYIIAIILAMIHKVLFKQVKLRVAIVGILVILLPYFAVTKLHDHILTKSTGFETSISNSGGWNIFVGSNYNSLGRWSQSDNDQKSEILKEVKSVDKAQLEYKNRGISRWEERSLEQNVTLLFNKSVIIAGEQSNSAYNIDSISGFWPSRYIGGVLTLFMALMIFLNLLFIRKFLGAGGKRASIIHVMVLFVIGVFLAQLLVEVSARYFLPILPTMIVLASLALLKATEMKKLI